jgi:uncharacterized protein YjbI with pentapeptide repeats
MCVSKCFAATENKKMLRDPCGIPDRYSTLLYVNLRYSTLLYATLRYSTLLYATLRYATLRYATLLYSIV